MRVEEFLQRLNTNIEHYELMIKLFIASVAVLIAYNYFFVPSLLLLSAGAIVYVYMKTQLPPPFSNSNRDWSALDKAQEPLIPPIELAAPAPAPELTPVPVP